MITAQQIFNKFVKDNGRFPTLEEFYNLGYKRATYYNCKRDYKPEGDNNG